MISGKSLTQSQSSCVFSHSETSELKMEKNINAQFINKRSSTTQLHIEAYERKANRAVAGKQSWLKSAPVG